jgi:hypothetical protein
MTVHPGFAEAWKWRCLITYGSSLHVSEQIGSPDSAARHPGYLFASGYAGLGDQP